MLAAQYPASHFWKPGILVPSRLPPRPACGYAFGRPAGCTAAHAARCGMACLLQAVKPPYCGVPVAGEQCGSTEEARRRLAERRVQSLAIGSERRAPAAGRQAERESTGATAPTWLLSGISLPLGRPAQGDRAGGAGRAGEGRRQVLPAGRGTRGHPRASSHCKRSAFALLLSSFSC